MGPLALRKLVKTFRRGERGQILILAAGGMVAILGFTALATDVGLYLNDLREAQNDADAAALAGAQALMLKPPDEAMAVQLAEEWATNNDAGGQVVWTGEGDCGARADGDPIPWGLSDSNGDNEPDTICLAIERSTPALFAPVLGIESFPVGRRASARAVHADHGAVCPWAIRADDPGDDDPSDGVYMGIEMGKIYSVKTAGGERETGNFGILRLYDESCHGGGTDCYRELIESGCAASGYNAVTEGDVIETSTEPGNVGNPTMNALGTLFGYELTDGIEDGQGFAWCDVPMDWDEDAAMGVPTGYDPRGEGPRAGCGTDSTGGRSGRYMLIPIVDGFPPTGTGPVQILAIANVYMAGWGVWDPDTNTYGRSGEFGHAQVYVEFVEEAPFKPKDLMGESDNPLAPMRIILIR